MTIANFIIAGTEKAGTTSVFTYLGGHPQVTASRRKETDFFRSNGNLRDYAACFPDADTPVVMEASPGYLGEAEAVVPRLQAMIPDIRLLFILREPVARFHSSFQFHKAKLNLPDDMDLHDYLEACLRYVDGGEPEIPEWFLKVLPFGCYADYLARYFDAFPRENILVLFYDELRDSPRAFMERVGAFLAIDGEHWASADFEPRNVTFSGRSRILHRLAVSANDALEPLLRPRPRLKSAVVGLYKQVNRAREGYDAMAPEDLHTLEAFYAPHNRRLQRLLGTPLPDGWSTGECTPELAVDRRRDPRRVVPE